MLSIVFKRAKASRIAAALLGAGALFAQTTADLTVHIEVNLVQVDAVVIGKDNRPIRNLTAADFEILQDGKPQPITHFAFINAAPPKSSSAKLRGEPLPPPVDLKPADVRRTFAIVVDDLGLAWENLNALKKALRKFVIEGRQPSDLVAIIPTGGGMGALQQFTSDPKLLLAAIDHLKFNPLFNRVGISSFRPLDPNRPPTDPLPRTVSRIQTFESLRAVVRGLRDLPGRKMLLLVSESMEMGEDLYMREFGDQANRASVVIYGLDPRGLVTFQLTSADDASTRTPQDISKVPFQRSNYYFTSQGGLDFLARETGGLFFHGSNDLGAAVTSLNSDSAGYYLIGYTPDSTTFGLHHQQETFHKLEVRAKRPGLRVRSRAGFFSIPTVPKPAKDLSRTVLSDVTRRGQFDRVFDSPFAESAIRISLSALFVDTAQQGPVIETLLHIDAGDLKFVQDPDGTYRAEVDVVSQVSAGQKEKPEVHGETVAIRLGAEAYRRALTNGITSRQLLKAGQAGPYFVKVAVRDNQAEAVGSGSQFLEVPDLKPGALSLSGIIVSGAREKESARNVSPGAGDQESGLNPAVRIFPRGRQVFFAYQILNARSNDQNLPELLLQTRLFRNGKQVYESPSTPFDAAGHGEAPRWEVDRELALGSKFEPGQYVLQVLVTDKLAKNKMVAQSTDFEIR